MKLQIDPTVERALAARPAGRRAGIDADLSRSAAAAQPRTGARGRGRGPRGGRRAGHHRHRRRHHPGRARRRDARAARPGRRRGQMLAARPGAGAGARRAGRHHGRRHHPYRRRAPASGSWRRAASAGCIAAARPASTSRPTCTSSPAPASPWSAAGPRSSSTCRARWRCWRRWRCRSWATAAPASRPSMPATAGCRCPSSTMCQLAALVRAQAEPRLAGRHRGRQPAASRAGAAPASSWSAGSRRRPGRRAGPRHRRQGHHAVPAGGAGAAQRRPHGDAERGPGAGQCPACGAARQALRPD